MLKIIKKIKNTLFYTMLLLYSLLVVFVIYAVVFLILSSQAFSKSMKITTGDMNFETSSPALQLLNSQRSFLNVRLKLVDEDSVSLTVNLADSTVTIEQKGVILHSARISAIHISRILQSIDPDLLSKRLSSPMQVTNCFSTIPKIKYVLKTVPNDTMVPLMPIMPDTSDNSVVCYRFTMDSGIQIDIKQKGASGSELCKKFNRDLRINESKKIMHELLALRVPQFNPVIFIELPAGDAKSIYKALPVHPKLVVRI